jgi:membrane-associated protease RseP (regulator of RpoE activity)
MLARASTPLLLFLLFAGLLAGGCQTAPPVQEMSDARQAIMAARDAGAEEKAAEELTEAVEHLQAAEAALADKAYARARRDAVVAKNKAISALQHSEVEVPPQ